MKVDKSCIIIDGCLQRDRSTDREIDIEALYDDFINWVESRGLLFGGIIKYNDNKEK